MGILDTTSRWVDTTLTLEGRRALTEGELDIRYFSLSDAGASYLMGGEDGGSKWLADPENLLQLEAYSHPRDLAVITRDAFGDVVRDDPFYASRQDFFFASPGDGADVFSAPIELDPTEENSASDFPLILSGKRRSGELEPGNARLTEGDLETFLGGWSRDFRINASIAPFEGLGEVTLETPWGDARSSESEKNYVRGELPWRLWLRSSASLLEQHLPLHQDSDAAALPQFAYLPPVVRSGEGDRSLGEWGRLFPEPKSVSDSYVKELQKGGGRIGELDLENGEISIQVFKIDRQLGLIEPLIIIEAPLEGERSRRFDSPDGDSSGPSLTASWVVGEIIDAQSSDADMSTSAGRASQEHHFYRLFRVRYLTP